MSSSSVYRRRRLTAVTAVAAAALALAAAITALQAPASASGAPAPRTTTPRPAERAASPAEAAIPHDFRRAYRAAGTRFGVSWKVLAAIGAAESRHGSSTAPGVRLRRQRRGLLRRSGAALRRVVVRRRLADVRDGRRR